MWPSASPNYDEYRPALGGAFGLFSFERAALGRHRVRVLVSSGSPRVWTNPLPCRPGVEDMTGSLCAARPGRVYGHLTLASPPFVRTAGDCATASLRVYTRLRWQMARTRLDAVSRDERIITV